MTRRAVAAVLALLGLCFLVVGLLLGMSSVSRDGVSCGSAFGGTNTTAIEQADNRADVNAVASNASTYPDGQVAQACSDALSNRKPLAWAATVPGFLLLAGGLLLARGTREVVPAEGALERLRAARP